MATEIGIVLTLEGARTFIRELLSAQQELTNLAGLLEQTAQVLDSLEGAFKTKKTGKIFDDLKVDDLIVDLNAARSDLIKLGNGFGQFAKDFASNNNTFETVAKNLGYVAKESKDATDSIKGAGEASKSAAEGVESLGESAAKSEQAFSKIDFEKLSSESFTQLSDNIRLLAVSLTRLGEVSTKYPDLNKPLGGFLITIQGISSGKITSVVASLDALAGVITRISSKEIKFNEKKATGIAEFVTKLTNISASQLKQVLGEADNLKKFTDSFDSIESKNVTSLGKIITQLERLSQFAIPKHVTSGVKELTDALSAFVRRISGQYISENINVTVAAFKKLLAAIQSISIKNVADDDPIKDLVKNFATLEAIFKPLTTLISTFGVQFQPVVQEVVNLQHALDNISKVEATKFVDVLTKMQKSLLELYTSFNTQNLSLTGFASDIKELGSGLDELARALATFGRSKNIKNFVSEIDEVIKAINRMVKELDIGDFFNTIKPVADEIDKLGASIKALYDISTLVGKASFTNLISTELERQRQETVKLRTEGRRLSQEAITARREDEKRNKTLRERQAILRKQRAVNKEFIANSFKESSNIIDRFIGKFLEAEETVKPGLKVRITVLGFKSFTKLIALFTALPIQATLGIAKGILAIGKALASLGLRTINAGLTLFLKLLSKVGRVVLTVAQYVGQLAFKLIQIPFRIINGALQLFITLLGKVLRVIGTVIQYIAKMTGQLLMLPFRVVNAAFNLFLNLIKGGLKLIFALVVAFTKLFIWSVKLIAKLSLLTAIIKVIILPFKILTNAVNLLTGSINKLTNTMQRNSADKMTTDVKELNAETALAAQGQQKLQIELSETDRELEKAQVGAVKTQNALQGMNLVASGISLAKTFATGRALTNTIKQVISFTIAFRALQKATQLVNIGFQRVRFYLTGIIRDAFNASAAYEQLTLSLTALTRLDLKEVGAIGNAASLEEYAEEAKIVQYEVQGLLKWIRALAINSPFQEKDVAQVLKYAQAMGFTTDEAKVLTQTVVDFGAGTGATADKMESIIRALGQMKNNTILAKEELNQLAEAGYRNPLGALAEGLGLDTAATLEAITDKAISADVAISILTKRMQAEFAGSAIKATKTLAGLLSTMQSLRDNILREFLTPSFDIFKPLVAELANTESIEAALKRANELGQQFAEYVQQFSIKAIKAIGTLVGIFKSIPKPVKIAIAELIRFVAIMASVVLGLVLIKTTIAAVVVSLGILLNPLSLAVAAFVAFNVTIISIARRFAQNIERMVKYVQDFYKSIEPSLRPVVTLFQNMIRGISNLLSKFVTNVYNYGYNIGVSLANGITAAIGAVVNAIGAIASAITYWLKPGSPPRALPNIDSWGTAAANEYLEGFVDADISNIEDFGNTIGDLIKALDLPEGTIDVNDLQKDYAELIDSFNNEGISDSAVQDFFEDIRKESGAASEDFINLADAYVGVAKEQAKLNELTNKYNEELRASNQELENLSRQEAILDQQQELENINRTLNNRFATTEAKQLAEIKRQKILADQRKAEIEAQQDNVDAQQDSLDLLKKRIGLDAQQTEDTTAAGGADSLGKLAKEKAEEVGDAIANLGEGLNTALEPAVNLKEALDNLELPKLNIGEIFQEAQGNITKKIKELRDRFAELGITLNVVKVAAIGVSAVLFGPTILRGVATLATGLAGLLKALRGIAAIGLLGAGGLAAIGFALVLFADKITPEFLTSLGNAFTTFGKGIADFFTAYTTGLGSGETGFTSLSDLFNGLFALDPTAFATQLGATFATIRETVITYLTDLGTDISGFVNTYVIEPFMNAFTLEGGGDPMFDSRGLGQRILDGIVASLTTIGTSIQTTISTFITDNIVTPFRTAFALDGELDFRTVGQQIADGLIAVFEPVKTQIETFLGNFIDIEALKQKFDAQIKQPFLDTFNSIELALQGADLQERIKAGIIAVFTGLDIQINLAEYFTFAATEFPALQAIQDFFVNIKDNIPQSVLDAFTFFFDRFKENLSDTGLADKLSTLGAELVVFARNLGIVIAGLAGAIALLAGGLFAELPVIIGGVLDILNGLIGGINDFVNIFIVAFQGGDVKQAILDFLANFRLIQTGIANIIEAIINVITDFGISIALLLGRDVGAEFIEKMRMMADIVGHILSTVIVTLLVWQTKILQGFAWFGGRLIGLAEWIVQVFGLRFLSLTTIAASIITFVEGIVDSVRTFFVDLGNNISTGFDNLLLDFAFFISNMIQPIYDFSDNVAIGLSDVSENFANFFNDLAAKIEENFTTAFNNSFGLILGDFDTFKANLSAAITVVVDLFTNIINAIINLKDTFAPIAGTGYLAVDLQPLQDLYDILSTSIPAAIVDLIAAFTGIDITDPFSVITVGAQLLTNTLNTLLTIPETLADNILAFVARTTGLVIPNPFTILKETIEVIPTSVQSIIDKFNELKSFFDGLTLNVPSLDGLGEKIDPRNWFKGDQSEVSSVGEETGKEYVAGVQDTVNTSKVEVKSDIITPDTEGFTQVGYNSGVAIIEGTNKGIEETAGADGNVFQRAGTAMRDGWNNWWGTNSPSTVARDEMGIPIAEGIIEGIALGVEDGTGISDVGDQITAQFDSYALENGPEIGRNFIQKILEGINSSLAEGGLFSSISESSEGGIGSALTTNPETFDSVLLQFSTLFENIILALEEFVEEYTELYTEYLENITELLTEHVETYIQIVEDTFAQIIELLVAFSIQVIELLKKLLDEIERVMKRFEEIMREAARKGVEAFLAELEGLAEKAKEALINGFDAVKQDLLDYFYDYGYDLGEKFADGIEKGLLDQLQDIIDTGKGMIDDAYDAWKAHQEQKSPSARAARELGMPWGQGIAAGLRNSIPEVISSMLDVADNLHESAKDALLGNNIDIPLNVKYNGLYDTLPDLTQNVNLRRNGASDIAGISNMQSLANATIVNNTNNYNLNMTVREDAAVKVKRNFNKMQQLRI